MPSEIAGAFMMDHVIDDGLVRSKYTPGWPALLAIGEYLAAAWLINPLLSVLTLWLVFRITERLVDRLAA